MTEDFTVNDSKIWGVISAAIALSISFSFERPKSIVVGLSIALLIFLTRVFWELRSSLWFWISILVFAALHAAVVFYVPFGKWNSPVIYLLYIIGFPDAIAMFLWFEHLKRRLGRIDK